MEKEIPVVGVRPLPHSVDQYVCDVAQTVQKRRNDHQQVVAAGVFNIGQKDDFKDSDDRVYKMQRQIESYVSFIVYSFQAARARNQRSRLEPLVPISGKKRISFIHSCVGYVRMLCFICSRMRFRDSISAGVQSSMIRLNSF